jgi:hypothetical protein
MSRSKEHKGPKRPYEEQEYIAQDALKALASSLNNEAVWQLRPDLHSIIVDLDAREQLAKRAQGEFTNTVVMPGTVLDTNAGEVRGSTAVWKFSHEHFAMMDYPMHVESRVVNLWITIGTGLLVVLALGSLLFLRRRQTV